jgi:hypothetical protein
MLEKLASICKLLLSAIITIELICGGGLLSSRCELRKSRYPPVLDPFSQTPLEHGDS